MKAKILEQYNLQVATLIKTDGTKVELTPANGKSFKYFCKENPMDRMKRQKDMTPEDEPPPFPGWKASNMLPGKGKRQLLIALERMK